jgi:hypothetical protein
VLNALRIAAILLLAPVAHAQDLASARAFVHALYGAYEHPATLDGPDVLGKSAPRIFSPSLLQLIRYDQAHTPRGDAPDLDGDPICDCQDFDGLRLSALTVTSSGPTTASAHASLKFTGANAPVHVILLLVYTPRGWRIDDTSTADMPSLRKFLRKSH